MTHKTLDQFDVKEFNKQYEIYLAKQKEQTKTGDILQKKEDEPPKYKFYEITVGQHVILWRDTWFGIFDDIMNLNFSQILTKGERFFYVGITLIIISIFFLSISSNLDKTIETTKD